MKINACTYVGASLDEVKQVSSINNSMKRWIISLARSNFIARIGLKLERRMKQPIQWQAFSTMKILFVTINKHLTIGQLYHNFTGPFLIYNEAGSMRTSKRGSFSFERNFRFGDRRATTWRGRNVCIMRSCTRVPDIMLVIRGWRLLCQEQGRFACTMPAWYRLMWYSSIIRKKKKKINRKCNVIRNKIVILLWSD